MSDPARAIVAVIDPSFPQEGTVVWPADLLAFGCGLEFASFSTSGAGVITGTLTMGNAIRAVGGSVGTPSIGFGGESSDTDTGFYRVAANEIGVSTGGTLRGTFNSSGLTLGTGVGLLCDKTVTAAGTTGNRTINKMAGSVNFAAATSSLVVTNSLVTANSVIIATVATQDGTLFSVSAIAASGSFTLIGNDDATAETRVNFVVIN